MFVCLHTTLSNSGLVGVDSWRQLVRVCSNDSLSSKCEVLAPKTLFYRFIPQALPLTRFKGGSPLCYNFANCSLFVVSFTNLSDYKTVFSVVPFPDIPFSHFIEMFISEKLLKQIKCKIQKKRFLRIVHICTCMVYSKYNRKLRNLLIFKCILVVWLHS